MTRPGSQKSLTYEVEIHLVLQQRPNGEVLGLLQRRQVRVEVGKDAVFDKFADDERRVAHQLVAVLKADVGHLGARRLPDRAGLYSVGDAAETQSGFELVDEGRPNIVPCAEESPVDGELGGAGLG